MPQVSVVTWNVNSVRSRLEHLTQWLRADKPDIVLLQELKCTNDQFPYMEIEELGYNVAVHGEKTYNGVAILSKFPLEDVTRGLPGNESDTQSRYIEAIAVLPYQALRVASVYVPNGQTTDSEKFPYKLSFLSKLRTHARQLLEFQEMLVIGGDYNIAPEDADVHEPKAWHGSVLTHDAVRAEFRTLLHMSYYDAYRLLHTPDSDGYSWWDYRNNALERNDGLRIDHLLLSPQAADKINECSVIRSVREQEKASDHAPVRATLEIS